MFWRERAQRKLVERGAGRPDGGRDVVPAVIRLVEDSSVDAIGLNPAAIHAIWTLKQLGALEGPHADSLALARVQSALAHPSAGVRMNAVKALPRDAGTLTKLAGSTLADDPAPLVRLAVLEALGEWAPSPEAGSLVTKMLADPRTLADPILADAATSAAAVQAAGALPSLVSVQSPDPKPSPTRLTLIERVAEHVARGADGAAVAAILVKLPDAAQATAAAALSGFARGWPKGTAAAFGEDADRALVRLAESLPADVQGQVVTLAQHAGSKAIDSQIGRISEALIAALDNAAAEDADRIAVAERLVQLCPADAQVATLVMERVGGRTTPEVSAGLITALGKSLAAEAPTIILDRLGSFTPPVREAAIRTLLANRDWAALLVDRLEKKKVAIGDIPIADRAKLTEHPDRRVRDRARKAIAAGGGLPNADRQKVIDEILPVVTRGGDADRGRALFKEQCGKCHMHSGEGGKVGPELTGMAVHPAHELLIHILDPNRSVEGNYRAYAVTTDDGRVVTGLLAAESKTAIEIVDAEGKRVAIQRSEIDVFQPSPNSLMPVGFEKQIKPEGFADLLAFLTKRGTFLPLPLEKVATAVSTKGMFQDQHAVGERLVFPDWTPKQFRGVPFTLVDPQENRVPNAVMLQGPIGSIPPQMPKSVSLSVGSPIRAVHLLGGIAGWGFPATGKGETSMIVRLVYADGVKEDHPLINGEHIADYIRRVDVPQSEFAFDLDGRQLRYLRIQPKRAEPIASIDLVKGTGGTAPIVMAITLEMP